jgi:hypothetical protein
MAGFRHTFNSVTSWTTNFPNFAVKIARAVTSGRFEFAEAFLIEKWSSPSLKNRSYFEKSRRKNMAWTAGTINRIYELYGQHIQRMRTDVITANRLLGSSNPEKTALRCLTRVEFEAKFQHPTDDAEIRDKWLRRIIRGHEHEFPEFAIDTREILNITSFVKPHKPMPRKTGT